MSSRLPNPLTSSPVRSLRLAEPASGRVGPPDVWKSGSFDAVLGRGLRRALHSAAADLTFDVELGAIRLALVRLLREERDPQRLAAGVASLARVAHQIAAVRSRSESGTSELAAILQRELDALDREQELARALPQTVAGHQ